MTRGKRVFVVGLVAAATVPVVYVLTRPSAGELLTRERLEEAKARWKERGPRSYALDVQVGGTLHHIEVKDGTVVAMTTGGNPVAEKRAWEHWNVEGMFGFLSGELSNLQRPEGAFGVTDPDDVILRARFDAHYGYPSRFLRHVIQRQRGIEWEVRSFEPR